MSRSLHVRDLPMQEIEEAAEDFKADLQREANRCARRHDNERAVAALEGIDYIDKFLYTLKVRAVSGLREYLSRPARARPIHINKALRSK